jgi:hypothetical protein
MYRAPLFFQQVHRALVASGSAVVGEIGKILRHEHNDVNALFKDKKLDKYCGDPGDTPSAASDCQDVSAMDYYAALVAGDLHDKALVPDLITALNRKQVPAYYQDFNPGPPAQGAILDSLRKIGDPSSADAVLKVAADTKGDDNIRNSAITVYGFVSKDGSEKTGNTTGLKMLAGIAADNSADTGLRLAASESYARLADDASDAKVLAVLAKKYYDASNDAAKERTTVAADYDAKKAAFDKLRDPFLTAQADVERAKIKFDDAKKLAGNDPKKVPKNIADDVETKRAKLNDMQKDLDQARADWSKAGPEKSFKAAEAEYNKAGDDYNTIKAKLEKAKGEAGGDVTKVDPDLLNEAAYDKQYWEWLKTNVYLPTKLLYDGLNQKSDGYKGYERGFENHIARIEIVMHCKGDAKCYADALDQKPADVYARFKALLPTFKDDKGKTLVDVDDKQWTEDDKAELRTAEAERAMLELRKLGEGARPQMDKLLAHAADTDRLVRQSILLALPRISPLPCPQCKTALDDAIAKGKGKQELDELNYETQLLSNWYAWAGGK